MVVPKSGVKGNIEISVMVDGRTYLVDGNFPQALKSGSIYTFKLTLDNTALSIAGDVEVTPWLEDDSVTTENNGVLKPNA
jgi:hypothetical protein